MKLFVKKKCFIFNLVFNNLKYYENQKFNKILRIFIIIIKFIFAK